VIIFYIVRNKIKLKVMRNPERNDKKKEKKRVILMSFRGQKLNRKINLELFYVSNRKGSKLNI
jgi:hypothetical protein